MAAAQAGIGYEELTERILESAMARMKDTGARRMKIPFRKRPAKRAAGHRSNQWKGPARCKWRIRSSKHADRSWSRAAAGRCVFQAGLSVRPQCSG